MKKSTLNIFETERIVLRRFKDSDLSQFLAYRNDPEIAKYQSWETTSESEAISYIQRQKILQPGIPGQWQQFAIELKEIGSLVGDCGIKIDERENRQGEIGFTLSGDYQGRGIASEAVSQMLSYAFTELKLHRIIAITDYENTRSKALLERLGFRQEGHFIENIWFKGKWGDEYLYAILEREWNQKREATHNNIKGK